jgi:ABC-type proline/glycine betaine transport system ATPase subunit
VSFPAASSRELGVARALANDPDIILMDGRFPRSIHYREQLQDELLKLHDEMAQRSSSSPMIWTRPSSWR